MKKGEEATWTDFAGSSGRWGDSEAVLLATRAAGWNSWELKIVGCRVCKEEKIKRRVF